MRCRHSWRSASSRSRRSGEPGGAAPVPASREAAPRASPPARPRPVRGDRRGRIDPQPPRRLDPDLIPGMRVALPDDPIVGETGCTSALIAGDDPRRDARGPRERRRRRRHSARRSRAWCRRGIRRPNLRRAGAGEGVIELLAPEQVEHRRRRNPCRPDASGAIRRECEGSRVAARRQPRYRGAGSLGGGPLRLHVGMRGARSHRSVSRPAAAAPACSRR